MPLSEGMISDKNKIYIWFELRKDECVETIKEFTFLGSLCYVLGFPILTADALN